MLENLITLQQTYQVNYQGIQFVNYEATKYFTDRQAMTNFGEINNEEQQKPPHKMVPRDNIQQAEY